MAYECLLVALKCFLVGVKMWHRCNKCHIYPNFYLRMSPPRWNIPWKTFCQFYVTFWKRVLSVFRYICVSCQFCVTFQNISVSFMSHIWFWKFNYLLNISIWSFVTFMSHFCEFLLHYVTFWKFRDQHSIWVPIFHNYLHNHWHRWYYKVLTDSHTFLWGCN